MHEVRSTLGKTSADPASVLSPDILSRCENTAFWQDLVPVSADVVSDTVSNSGVNSSFFQTANPGAEPSNIIGA
jgi:hypothetical protein